MFVVADGELPAPNFQGAEVLVATEKFILPARIHPFSWTRIIRTRFAGGYDRWQKLAFLGLGGMGYSMAGHLAANGHEVTVYNRTMATAEAWVAEHQGAMAATPREAAEGADFVTACVGNDDDLRDVCIGPDGAFAGMATGSIFVDHTTVPAAVTREMFAAAEKAWNRLCRCASLRWAGRRRKWSAFGDVRWRQRAV